VTCGVDCVCGGVTPPLYTGCDSPLVYGGVTPPCDRRRLELGVYYMQSGLCVLGKGGDIAERVELVTIVSISYVMLLASFVFEPCG